MPHVRNFIYCEEVRVENIDNKSRMQIINPKMVFIPEFIPGQFSFSVVINIINIDPTAGHMFRYVLSGPDKAIIVDTKDVPAQGTKSDTKLPPELEGVSVSLDFRNVSINQEGAYESEIFINGSSLGKYPIHFVRAKKNE